MKNSLCKTMKSDRKTFRNHALGGKTKGETVQFLTEHYPMLERCIRQSAEECRKTQKQLKDPELLPGLFGKCIEMCGDGVLPDSDGIINYFGGEMNGICAAYLPLAITCALLHKCAEAVAEDNCEMLKKSVLSLQKMRDTDFDYISEKLFAAEEIIASDPAGVYPHMDNGTKMRYRRKIASLALESGKSEQKTAMDILQKAEKSGEHIGNFLFTTVKNKRRGTVYLIMEALLPALVCISAAILSGEWLISILLYIPIWEIMRHPVEKASVKGMIPEKFLRLDPQSETVLNAHALITLSVILPSADEMNELKDKLENLYLSNTAGNIKVCCLADFKAADMPRRPEDKHILNALNNAVDDLNRKYGGGFIAAVRPRSYSETQNEFIGKERKRGAVRELIRAIKGNEKVFLSIKGDTEHLSDTKYLIALDYDSVPVFDSVRELIAVAEHPVNKPVIKNGRVVSGYGILAPKTQNSLSGASKTFFSSVMSHNPGISSYDEASCERYRELFGESIFCGKGLINVDAYYELLDKGLPRERILSHDIIEGELLRTGFVSEVQIIEDFPSTTEAYYKRLHRWVRGDWQNAGFIFGKSPLNFVSRFKLIDNLRRSVNSAVCLAVVAYSAFYQGYAGIAAAVVSAFALCAADVFAGINSVVYAGFSSVTNLYYSKKLPEALGCFVRAFLSVAYSAREAFFCIDAAVRALWRVLISGDNLLEWTTSASAEQNDESDLLVSCLPALAAAALLIVFGLPIHRMIGLIILGDIPLTLFGNAPIMQRETKITAAQREYLLSHASAMWGYFEDLCGEENNFLPPDNLQLAPHRAVAKRTSPTNIGLMLACFVAARDFGFITTNELYSRLDSSLSSIEKLEKYNGNLLNWYSTSTLETLEPRFVSAVDSGNFLCCLTAVKEGISEYINECKALEDTAKKIEKMIASTDLSVMYNKQRRLFHIGINPDSGEKTESCYDLYMSEIRMTAYLAVARKYVQKNHWAALDRPLVKSGRYTGLASWTGTMFEYFMADIFIPAPYGSLSDEALHFCLQSQRKKAGKNPFGISESAFYAFDGDLNYQYKAHGVQKLGFKRNLDKENVISPYSSFLTLNIAPQLSVKNLKRLEKLGMTGKYGFYEAADFTSGRNSGGFSLVNSFMAHHVGMSFLALDNLLNGKCMQKRFMRDRYMSGARTLLEEKPPYGKENFRDVVSDTVIPRIRERIHERNADWSKPDINSPNIYLYANGRMTMQVSDTGIMNLILDGENAASFDVPDSFECSSERYAFCSSDMKARMSDSVAEYQSDYGNLALTMQIYLLRTDNCIVKRYYIENKDKENDIEGRVTVYFDKKNINGCFLSGGFLNAESRRNGSFSETDIKVSAGETEEVIFAFAADTTEDEAVNSFEALKVLKNAHKKAGNPFCKDSFQQALSEKYLSDIIRKEHREDAELQRIFGITGDYPIILVEINKKEQLDTVRPFVVFNKILRNCGIKNTLVIYSCVTDTEKNAVLQTIEAFLKEEGCSLMLGIGGGVYILDGDLYKKTDYEKLKEYSVTETLI